VPFYRTVQPHLTTTMECHGNVPISTILWSSFSALFPLVMFSSQSQALPNVLPHNVLILFSPFSPHPRRIHIRRTLIVWLGQHAHDTYQDFLNALDWRPSLRGLFVLERIVAWWVEDGYAYFAVWIDYVICVSFVLFDNLQPPPSSYGFAE
jgi:hypothetical protein